MKNIEQKLNYSLTALPKGLAVDPWGNDAHSYNNRASLLSKLRIKYWPASLTSETVEQRFSDKASFAKKLSGHSAALRASRLVFPTTLVANASQGEESSVEQMEELVEQNELALFPIGIEISPKGISLKSLYKIYSGNNWFVTGFSGPEGDTRLSKYYNLHEKSILATTKLAKKIGAKGINYYLSDLDSNDLKMALQKNGFKNLGQTPTEDTSYGPINRFFLEN